MLEAPGGSSRPTRLILYVGKGGVGKSTIAAATAVRAASLGHRTLVVSTDSAHSLGDVLGVELGSEPRSVAPGLDAQEINVLEEVRRNWGKAFEQFTSVLRRNGATDIQADEMAMLPGLEEMTALVLIGGHIANRSYDCLVVDAAPTGETVRLLSLPDTYQWYVGRIREIQQRFSRISGPLLRGLLPDLGIVEQLTALTDRVKELRRVLVDPHQSSYRIVLTPDRVVLKEALRAATYLSIFDYPVDAIVVNRLLSQSEAGNPFVDAMIHRQAAVMEEIQRAFPTLPVLVGRWRSAEPVGLDALETVGQDLFAKRDPSEVFAFGPTQRIDRSEAGYVLKIPMANAELSKLSLRKRGDSLYIDLGGYRREVVLPRALASLEPQRARYRAGTLEIPFEASGTSPVPVREG